MIKNHPLFYVLVALIFSCYFGFNFAIPLDDYGDLIKETTYTEDTDQQDQFGKIKLASWNIRHLGRTKTPEDIYEIANILRDFDVVAIQEVVAKDPAGAQAVAKIADELNRMGFKWDYQISDPTKSPSVYMSERYAFLWKTSKVSLVGRAYLDKELEELCYREPFIATFKIKGKSNPFYVVNYHSRKFDDNPHEEIINFLDFPERLNSNRVLIAGDFNLNEKHIVWEPFYSKGFKSALQNERTTLKTVCKNGDYRSHPIDNVYFTSGIEMIQAKTIDFVGNCKKLERAREISDHLPIFMEFK
ncbi:endonuclease [Bizionia argentinensis JUB59]|uniref:Endonuclease n=1 Tax=Bizionia argentinensis JUB59 TaxID=1046627 RepID=G2EGF9_9FLAO|nr:endonuclease/exonuclease/phosphatase family protein [Bizionia argentinensis]EGV42476.1 endonuclease [Bizionia argentinensis JUB59]